MDVGGRIRDARLRAGLSQDQLGEMVGANQTRISRLESGKAKRPDIDLLLDIGRALGFAPAELVSRDEENAPRIGPSEGLRYRPIEVGLPKSAAFSSDRNLPVRGVSRDGGGRFYLLGEDVVIDRTYRPTQLSGVPEAYALFVFEDNMAPMYKRGQTIWVHPHEPAKSEDGVVVVLNSGQILIREYVSQNDSDLRLREYGPNKQASESTVSLSDVRAIHRIIGLLNGR